MKLCIVSGRSGSGKTVTLKVLEDLGYYCVDNLPVTLLPSLIQQISPKYKRVAISIDARNAPHHFAEFKEIVEKIRDAGHTIEILYLDANENTLLTRFSETRRRHPLTSPSVSLREAIHHELDLLIPLANSADLSLDTTKLSSPPLCQIIRDRSALLEGDGLCLLIQSFGFKRGLPPDADFLFDLRSLPNPYWNIELRSYTGLDKPVIEFLKNQPLVQEMVDDIYQFLDRWIPSFEANNRSYLTIAIGCTGGQHRSVFVAEQLAIIMRKRYPNLQTRHRELAQV